jgi:hypothetical protein
VNINQVNYLNIGLMLISAALAFLYPFEAFLLAYAVLGPLHYLTEISWLHDRNYYMQGKGGGLFLTAVSVLVSVIFFGWAPFAPRGTLEFLTCLAFLAAVFFAFFKNEKARWVALIPAALGAGLITSFGPAAVFFGLFLPTLVHVFIFTGMFILVGALRGRSFSGLLSILVFAVLAAGLLLWHPAHAGYLTSPYVQDSYGHLLKDGTGSSPFITMNYYVIKTFRWHDFGNPANGLDAYIQAANDFLYRNPIALSFMSFVAFAYTYHYLNWFSKTSIIGWHEISRRRAWSILGLWVISLALYAYNYSVGLRWLFFLSFTHVLLEFPLNQLTLVGIGKEFRKMLGTTAVPAEVQK